MLSISTTTHHRQPICGRFLYRALLSAAVITTFTLSTNTVESFITGNSNVKPNHNRNVHRIGPKLPLSWSSSSFSLSSTTEDVATTTGSLATPPSSPSLPIDISRRKIFSIAATTMITAATVIDPKPVSARYILDEEGEYVQVPEQDWKEAWKSRLDKASTMSQDEIFNAARGAGNLDLKAKSEDGTYEESDASKKRRAMSACRDNEVREKVIVGGRPLELKECNQRVLAGEIDFIMDKL